MTDTGDELARVQAAWDSIPSLPPLDFTAFEARDLLSAFRPPQADNVLRSLLQEALPYVEAMEMEGDLDIRDLLLRIDAALKASPTTEPNPEGMKVAERVLPACNLGCEQGCPADYPTDLCCVTRRAVTAMQEASHTMKFSRVFIGSREKMHPDGQSLYDAAVAQLDAVLSTLTDTPEHDQEKG